MDELRSDELFMRSVNRAVGFDPITLAQKGAQKVSDIPDDTETSVGIIKFDIQTSVTDLVELIGEEATKDFLKELKF